MTEDALPKAVWSGDIMGVKVHVLDDGRRIVDADSLETFLTRLERTDGVDLDAFSKAYKAFLEGTGGG
jgi:hypothetical protein